MMSKSLFCNLMRGKLCSLSRNNINIRYFSRAIRLTDYKYAITRDIDSTLSTEAIRMNFNAIIDLDKAHSQHQIMTDALRSLGLIVTTIPSNGFPDSVFIEDTAVVIGTTALITRPGANSRRMETIAVTEYLQSRHPELDVTVMLEGTLDGGDVLFTGSEIYVGKTSRTDAKGIDALIKAFPTIPVIALNMDDLLRDSKKTEEHPPLHLKSFCSMCGVQSILVGGDVGLNLQHRITQLSTQSYNIYHVQDEAAANCLFINGTVVRRSFKEFPRSASALDSIGGPQIELEASELAKVDGALTCCSLLF